MLVNGGAGRVPPAGILASLAAIGSRGGDSGEARNRACEPLKPRARHHVIRVAGTSRCSLSHDVTPRDGTGAVVAFVGRAILDIPRHSEPEIHPDARRGNGFLGIWFQNHGCFCSNSNSSKNSWSAIFPASRATSCDLNGPSRIRAASGSP